MIEARFQLQQGSFTLEVDLALPGQGITVLLGPSGSGKTTLLRCLAGLQRAPSGRLVVGRQTWQDGGVFVPPHQRALGMVFQDAQLFPHLTVQGNLDYGRRRAGTAAASVSPTVELLGLRDLLARRPDSLSGGERQRVAIARALVMAPQLLLMDEPLAALDPQRKLDILPYLDRLQDELTLPIVYVTHAVSEAARLADHVVLLDQGRVTTQGALQTLLTQPGFALTQDEDAGVVLSGTVTERDAAWQLVRVDCSGAPLWTRDAGHALGQRLRVRLAARDVSLSLTEQTGSSVVNQLPGVVQALLPDRHPAVTLAVVRLGVAGDGEQVLARLTRQSVSRLGLAVAQPVWVQVKSMALL